MGSSLDDSQPESMSENGEYSGLDCFADDRDALNDFAKYFNNQHLSDISLIVEEERYAAHKLVLCRSSEVFDRMLSKRWNSKQSAHELDLSEDPECQQVFSIFLRFLYCNHVVLNNQNTLPLLILADKYSVHGLRKVCVEYASKHVLPFVDLKSLTHVWFKYSTTAYHSDLTHECVSRIARQFYKIISDEWETDWSILDRDQLIELLKSSYIILPNEFVLWEAVQRWFNSPQHPQRLDNSSSNLVKQILPLIRFPYMSADELAEVESSPIAQQHSEIILPLTHIAFKYISMTLASRAKSPEFNGIQFLVRNYSDHRWDKRLTIPAEQLHMKSTEHRFNITTRSSTFPIQQWDWELIFTRNGGTSPYSMSSSTRPHDELSIELKSVDLDQQRSIEYLLSIVDEKQLLCTFAGRKTFTKSRTTELLELENRLTLKELFGGDRIFLHNGELNMQLILRPIV